MRGFGYLTWTEFKLFLRDPVGAFFSLPFPGLLLLILGSVYGNRPLHQFGGLGNVDVLVPGLAAFVIASTGIMSLGIGMAAYREMGVLRRMSAAPVSPFSILGAQLTVSVMGAALGLLVTIAVAKLAYGLRFHGNPLSVAAAFLLGSLSIGSLGFVLAGVVRSSRTAWIAGATITFPMLFLSGALIPKDLLPATVRHYGSFLPLSPVVTLLRGLWAGGAWSGYLGDVGALLGMLVLGLALTAKTFRWE